MFLNPTDPRKCRDIGITMCCNDVRHREICNVHNQSGHCSCNLTCHQRKDCCPDVEDIGCIRMFTECIHCAHDSWLI